jgi:uncharacterized membrane protein
MTWIEGKAQKTFRINAPLANVYEFFITPAKMAPAFSDLERHEVIDEKTVRWVYKKKKEKGITFQPDCTTRYSGNGTDQVQWAPGGSGNLRSSGMARLKSLGDAVSEVEYEERSEVDLPIPSLLAKIFRPIVAKELQNTIFSYLDRAKSILER